MQPYGMKLCIAAVSVGFGACMAPVETKRLATFATPPPVEQEGLAIELSPLGFNQLKTIPELTVKYQGQPWAYTSWLGRAPSFKVKISNKTNAVIRLAGAVIKLTDSQGNVYDAFDKVTLKQREEQDLQGFALRNPDAGLDVIATFAGRIDSLPLLSPATELLPGFTGNYYLIFDLPAEALRSQDDNAAWLEAHQPLKVVMVDFATGVRAPDGSAVKARYEFPITATTQLEQYRDGKLLPTSSK